MLSEKAARILLLLIRHGNRTMTAGKIAGALGISERSVNTYLKRSTTSAGKRTSA